MIGNISKSLAEAIEIYEMNKTNEEIHDYVVYK